VPPVEDEKLAENMRRNLAYLTRRMPAYVRSGTGGQVFGVLSLCRSLYTLRTGRSPARRPPPNGRWESWIPAGGRWSSAL
jgi:hypothetical protein